LLVVRTDDAAEMLDGLTEDALNRLVCIVIRDPSFEPEPLLSRGLAGPIDVLLNEPGRQYPMLYSLSSVPPHHPSRATIAVEPGFFRALRVAAALGIPVKLDVAQPEGALFDELMQALEFYLHDGCVRQPVEFFHSVFVNSLRGGHSTLWEIQEEDPRRMLYVDDDGNEGLPPRLTAGDRALPAPGPEFEMGLLANHPDCKACSHRRVCQGFFKWPNPDYACDAVRHLFTTIREGAAHLERDMVQAQAAEGGSDGA
jgi:hypothetical protein